MLLFRNADDLRRWLQRQRSSGQRLGFVPTMGALHQGHLSLLRQSQAENELTCCSIYVNPTQFNDARDLAVYPRPLENDIRLLAEAGCSMLFLPDDDQIYPYGLNMLHCYPLHPLDTMLEGASRPGHFQGVANVVDRLLHLVAPDVLYLGQKDFQQVKVVERLLAYRNHTTRLVMCPTVREPNGLAMSSRNVRLNPSQREVAANIWKQLSWLEQHGRNWPLQQARQMVMDQLNALPETSVDYLECCLLDSFTPVRQWPQQPIVWLVAVVIGGVRLLDNLIMKA